MYLRPLKIVLLIALAIAGIIIGFRFNVDLRVMHAVASLTHTDLSRVYGDNGTTGRFFYGPVTLVFAYPLGFLTYLQTQWVAAAYQSLSYLLFWLGLNRMFPILREKSALGLWLLVFCFAINPIHNNFQSGNIQLIITTALLWAQLFAFSDKRSLQITGGVLIALVTMVKVFPLYVIPFYVLTGLNWTVFGMFLGVIFSIVLPWLLFGTADTLFLFQSFLSNLGTYSKDNSLITIPDIMCLPSLIAKWFYAYGIEGQTPENLTKLLTIVISLIVYYFVWRNRKSSQLLFKSHWALVLAAMALLNPSTRVHYFSFYIPAFCVLVEESRRAGRWFRLGVASIFALVALTVEGVVGKRLNDQLEYLCLPTLGSLVLWAMLLGLVISWHKESKHLSCRAS